MNENLYFVLYANCIAVKGAMRATIYDLHRGSFDFISHALYVILTEHHDKTPKEIKAFYRHEHDETIDEYFQFLLDKEYIHFCPKDAALLFPKLDTKWEIPAKITNAVIDVGQNGGYINGDLVKQLEALGCNYLQLRVYSSNGWMALTELFVAARTSRIHLIELIVPYNDEIAGLIRNLQEDRLFRVIVYNAPSEKIDLSGKADECGIIYIKQQIFSEHSCGVIGPHQFAINIPHYTESLHHNTCLNRKIGIDQEGNIKNCPSMKESFGNIKDTTLTEAIQKPGFKKYWDITKDQVAVCRDCEFRHICTDCRAYLEDPEAVYSKPLKCGYNPYTCEWEEWSTNPLKQKGAIL